MNADFEKFELENGKGEKPKTGHENYAFIEKVWKEKGMKTFKDFLIYYNERDVGPFVSAILKLQEFYKLKNIDLFKSAISIPGVARKMLFDSAFQNSVHFSLFDSKNSDLYQTFNDNIIGGPSIIFKRQEIVNETLIRGKKECRNILGFDCNSLYLFALGRDMPTGSFIRRLESEKFRPKKRDQYMDMFYWMDFISQKRNITIQHKLNSDKEFRIGHFLVDGIYENEVFEYNGCYFHCHDCHKNSNLKKKRIGKK